MRGEKERSVSRIPEKNLEPKLQQSEIDCRRAQNSLPTLLSNPKSLLKCCCFYILVQQLSECREPSSPFSDRKSSCEDLQPLPNSHNNSTANVQVWSPTPSYQQCQDMTVDYYFLSFCFNNLWCPPLTPRPKGRHTRDAFSAGDRPDSTYSSVLLRVRFQVPPSGRGSLLSLDQTKTSKSQEGTEKYRQRAH